MHYQNKNNGFTLIELLVTTAIIAIVLGIAAPNMMIWINNARIKSITENIAQDLILARTEAIRLNKPIQLDVRSTCYGLTSKNSACNCTITDTSNSSYCNIKQTTLGANLTITKDTGQFNDLIFDSVRGLPVTNTFGSLASTQNITISNTTSTARVKLNIIGNVCISSPSGNTKIAGYPDAC